VGRHADGVVKVMQNFSIAVFVCVAAVFFATSGVAQTAPVTAPSQLPLRVAIVGLVHNHVHQLFQRLAHHPEITLVAIAEPNADVVAKYARRYSLDPKLMFADVGEMLDKARPQAVVVYTNTFDHRRVVELCAARGIHVMVEKPLAVSFEDALAMQAAAERGHIHVLVNYETSWYPCNPVIRDLVRDPAIGPIRRIVAQDGHQGPYAIHLDPEFIDWLIDPKLAGAGALYDFGCYGADLATWLMDGQRPLAVTAVTRRIRPQQNPLVDDDATIVLTYPAAQAVFEASWNWPVNRKDLEVYCENGYAIASGARDLRIRRSAKQDEERITAPPLTAPNDDPLHYLRAVVLDGAPEDRFSSLQTNVTVMEILDAARRSAATGQTVQLPPQP
jgi:glucose-fructose oxidoreductase